MRKFFTGVVSLALTAVTAVASVSSAAFNPNKDPNGDGQLTVSDATYIRKCLNGKYKPSNLSQLDVDENNVVSYVDAKYIYLYDSGLTTMSNPSGDEPDSVNTTYSSKTYNVYTAGGGVFRRSYTLSVEESDNGVSSPNEYYRPDDRVVDWSKSGVVKLYTDNHFYATGFVVGPHTIATAAHCLVDPEDFSRKMVSDIKFFDSEGEDEYEDVIPIEYHIPTDYFTSPHLNDYALITVDEDLSEYNIFNLGMMTDTFSTSQELSITGFPREFNDDDEHHGMYTGVGNFIAFNQNHAKTFTCDIVTSSGNSGSPVYLTEYVNGQVYNTVVGIHIHGEGDNNLAVRFDSKILKFYKSNPNIIYN